MNPLLFHSSRYFPKENPPGKPCKFGQEIIDEAGVVESQQVVATSVPPPSLPPQGVDHHLSAEVAGCAE